MIMKKFISILITIVTVGGIIAAVAWKLTDNKEVIQQRATLAQQRNDVIPVRVVTLEQKSIPSNFEATGTFQPFKQLTLISDVQGRITQLNVDNGDFLKEGTTVLAVDNELLQNQLDITKINLDKAQRDYNRPKNLLGDGGVTQQQVDDAQLGIENLKAQIRGLEKQIRNTFIKAPIAGTVTNKKVEKGAFLAPSMPVLDIVNVGRLKMQVYLTEDEVFQVRKGQRVDLKADLYPDRKLSGTIGFIDVKADPAKRFLVEIEMDNNSANPLKAGMNGVAYFNTGRAVSILALPRESIVGSIRDAKVFVAKNGVVELRPVTLGNIYGAEVAVVNGLTAGEQVVISGQINLEDGRKIQIK